jgi:hypothetical protein
MSDPLTQEQAKMLRRFLRREVTMDDPAVRELIGGITSEQLNAHAASIMERAERQKARHEALGQASDELVALTRQHGVETAGELEERGIENPFRAVAERLFRSYVEGEMTTEEVQQLGIWMSEGEVVIDLGQSWPPVP